MEQEHFFHLKPIDDPSKYSNKKTVRARVSGFKKESPVLFWVIVACISFYIGAIAVAVFSENAEKTNSAFIVLFIIAFALTVTGCVMYQKRYADY